MKNILPFFIATPLASAFLISLLGRKWKSSPLVLGFVSNLLLLIFSVFSVFIVKNNGLIICEIGGWEPPFGINMVLDGLTSFMLVTTNLVALLITLFSIDYMNKFTGRWKFYTLFLLMLAGMNGVIITGDMFNLFVFLEIASVASYALVAFGTESEELEASFKYLVMSTVGSLFVLIGIGILYSYTSTLNMADIGATLIQKGPKDIIKFVSVLFIMGFGLKAALVPFHAWLPDAHPSAPAPISAMLSGILIKALGIYAIIRIFYNVLGMNQIVLNILMFLGALSMVLGVFLAVGQWDLKRLLAYHSISQIGYIALGFGIGTPLGILGGLFHLFNHSVFKSLLFLNSGAIEYTTGTRDLKKMGGLREKLPVTGSTSLVASMSISGIPPFNGFFSKLIIIIAAVQSMHFVYAFWAVLASILTLASFMKVQKYAFSGKLNELWQNIKEVPIYMKLSMIILAVICLISGILLLPNISSYFLEPARDVLLEGRNYAEVVFRCIQ